MEGNTVVGQKTKNRIAILFSILPQGVYPRELKVGTLMFAHPYHNSSTGVPSRALSALCGFTYPLPPPTPVPGPNAYTIHLASWCGQTAYHLTAAQG